MSSGSRARSSCVACAGGARRCSCSATRRRAGWGTRSDPYHVGFAAYRWLLERLRPPLWLHGHTTPATVTDWRDRLGDSMVINVTGSVVVELVPPPVALAVVA